MNAPAEDLRVAVVCDYSLAYLGGAQTALLQEVAALSAQGTRVLVLSPSPPEVWTRVRPAEPVEHLQLPSACTLPGLDLPVVRNTRRQRTRLSELFTRLDITIVHLQSEFGLAAAAAAVAGELQLPVVHTVHTFFWQAPDVGQPLLAAAVRGFHRVITRLPSSTARLSDKPADSALRNMTLTMARNADLVLSPSAHQADRLRQAGLHQVAVLPNTVSYGSDAVGLTAVDGPLKIIWIGRCVPEKRILTFVRAATAALDIIGPDKINFTVVGDGPQLPEARATAGDRGGISFLGRQDHDHVIRLLAESHLAALTSYGFDNQPMTVVEAVRALRGVLYCDPALREGLEGPGILAPPDDAGLAAKLVELATDPAPVLAASQAAVEARIGFGPEHHAAELIKHYRRLLAGRGTP
ncbi:MAG: glycosyltransferase family 4 protein [Microlunatus sp.]|nr:glycosyltransferase family 4 protein [Microlunatus sp.]